MCEALSGTTHMRPPIAKVDTMVPVNANMQIAPILRKKGLTCNEKPASNMIGGSSAIKKKLVCERNRNQ